MQQLDNHFKKVQNPIKKKFEFRKIKQNVGEGIKDFALRLCEQANTCSFDYVEGEILQQLVVSTDMLGPIPSGEKILVMVDDFSRYFEIEYKGKTDVI